MQNKKYNPVGSVVFILGVILIVSGFLVFWYDSTSTGIMLAVCGILLLGFSEIINLLHRILDRLQQ